MDAYLSLSLGRPRSVCTVSLYADHAFFCSNSTTSICYCPRNRRQYCFSASSLSFFFSVTTITHEPLHLGWWKFARTWTLTTSRSLLNIKVIGQRSSLHGFLCAWYCLNQLAWIHAMLHRHGPRAVLSLEQGLTFFCRFVVLHAVHVVRQIQWTSFVH